VVEVPLLFETGLESLFDATIAVVAADEVRAARAGARGTAGLEGRAGRQLPQDQKAALATYVVRNEGTVSELETELGALIDRIAAGEDGA
jgi:dephospho-CoA kinase